VGQNVDRDNIFKTLDICSHFENMYIEPMLLLLNLSLSIYSSVFFYQQFAHMFTMCHAVPKTIQLSNVDWLT